MRLFISVLILSDNAVGKDSGVKNDNEIWNTFQCSFLTTLCALHESHTHKINGDTRVSLELGE